MKLNSYLAFNGNCEDALNFYKEAFNGTIETISRYGDAPMEMNEGEENRIMHAVLCFKGNELMFCDTSQQNPVSIGNNYSLSLNFTSPEETEQTFTAIAADGTVTMPLQETFWSPKFGMCTDRFGINWLFNYDKV